MHKQARIFEIYCHAAIKYNSRARTLYGILLLENSVLTNARVNKTLNSPLGNPKQVLVYEMIDPHVIRFRGFITVSEKKAPPSSC